MEMEAAGEVRSRLTNRWLWVVLSFLVIVIFGLVGAVIFLGGREDNLEGENVEMIIEQNQLAANDANVEVDKILGKLEDDPNYTIQDAEEDFGIAMLNSEGNKKFYIGADYAFFLYDHYEDLGRSLAILDELSEAVGDDLRVSYYMVYRNLYLRAGKDDEAREYSYKIMEMTEGNNEVD